MSKLIIFRQLMTFIILIISLFSQYHTLKGKCVEGEKLDKLTSSSQLTLTTHVKDMCFRLDQEKFNLYFKDIKYAPEIASGNFGTVYKYSNLESQLFQSDYYRGEKSVAVKVMKKNDYLDLFIELNSSLCILEYEDMNSNYSNEVAVIHYCFYNKDSPQRNYFFTMNFYPYTLAEFIQGKVKVDNYDYKIKLIMASLCLQVQKLHKHNFLHRDIKPANILLDLNLNSHLTDFGVSTTDLTRANSFVGSPNYMAPEVTRNEKYGQHIDLFSLGIVFHNLITRNLKSQNELLIQSGFSNAFNNDSFENYQIDMNKLEFPGEYIILRRLFNKNQDQSTALNDIINVLSKLIKDDLGILELNKRSKINNTFSRKDKNVNSIRNKMNFMTHRTVGNSSTVTSKFQQSTAKMLF